MHDCIQRLENCFLTTLLIASVFSRFLVPVLHTYNVIHVAFGAPDVRHARMTSSRQPGLGITLNYDVLGEPKFVIGDSADTTFIAKPKL